MANLATVPDRVLAKLGNLTFGLKPENMAAFVTAILCRLTDAMFTDIFHNRAKVTGFSRCSSIVSDYFKFYKGMDSWGKLPAPRQSSSVFWKRV